MQRVALLLVVLMMVPVPVIAQEVQDLAVDPVLVWEDPVGDTQRGAAAGPFSGELADLVSLSVWEDEGHVAIQVGLASLDGSAEVGTASVSGSIQVPILRGEREWLLEMSGWAEGWTGSLQRDFGPTGRSFTSIEVEVDVEANTVTGIINRFRLHDHEDRALTRGTEFVLGQARIEQGAPSVSIAGAPSQYQDAANETQSVDFMPDAVTTQTIRSVFGPPQEGPIWLTSHHPIRASNGEETTYLYTVNLTALGDVGDAPSLRFLPSRVPSGYEVRLPIQGMEWEGDTSIPVLLSVPARHEHGGVESFFLIMEGEGLHSEIELGVAYADPALWSGHHNTVRIYGGGSNTICLTGDCVGGPVTSGSYPLLTTEEDPEWASQYPMRASNSGTGGDLDGSVRTHFGWDGFLRGGMSLGLDFKEGGAGSMEFLMEFPVDILEGYLEVQLAHVVGAKETVITHVITEPQTLTGRMPFLLELPLEEGVDRFEADPNARITFELTVFGLGLFDSIVDVARTSPILVSGGTLTMPLVDYHDEVDDLVATVSPISMVLDASVKQGNAESLLAFPLQVQNRGSASANLRLEIHGDDSWLEEGDSFRFSVPAGGSVKQLVPIHVPRETAEETNQVFTLELYQGNKLLDLTQIRVDVVAEAVQDDEALFVEFQVLQENRDTPLVGMPFLVGLLAAVVIRKRR